MDRPNVSQTYLGPQGQEYFRLFVPASEHGRQVQAALLAPWCGPDKAVLDYGCGDGAMLRALPAAERLAVEVNPAARDACHARGQAEGKPVTLFADPAEVPDARVDTVVSNHVLEHIPNPLEALGHMARILRPGGTLALVVPFDDWRQTGHRRWNPHDKDHHLYTWTPLCIGNLLSEAGLEVQRVELRPYGWHPRLAWIDRTLGRAAFGWACRMLARLKNRREILCVARRPA